MNILFSSDNNYAKFLLVTIKSIINKNNHKINFYIFDFGIDKKNKEKIKKLENSNYKINFIPIKKSDFNDFPKTIEYISLATYARLYSTKYLPPDIDKILYLDIDIIVLGDLMPLWKTDINEFHIAACIDSFIEYKTNNYKKLIGLTEKDYYFNAGVLLINLKKWRTEDISQQSINWLKKYKNIIKYQDQDILNGIFMEKVYYLDCRFNSMPTLLSRIKNNKNLHPLEKNTMPIVISHFCGPIKQWDKNSTQIHSEIYEKIAKSLDIQFEKKNIFIKLKIFIKKIKYKFKYGIY
ncbi:glycosyltransferase family 8 protein [Otariodibacter oris]|uniref:Lipopolysaccharide biosynthesis glycosyltransferase n=1 Tax=Otariodibacter oris TaxID=1032623 RepID=A0A420XH41_9PAST|nr:glycosyltransferase family 8 protein [Otariodibacter oris]QGM81272.1 hypothetical protein A6A10_07550 [Otariodibacter oris]RKR72836.1 lipopolysaccharide biosynthesis glycosyltransferase [Otariodibacter oris]